MVQSAIGIKHSLLCLLTVSAHWRFGFRYMYKLHIQFLTAAVAAAPSPFVQAIYTPSKIDGGQVLEYENGLAAANAQMLENFNTSLLALQPASTAGKTPLGWPPKSLVVCAACCVVGSKSILLGCGLPCASCAVWLIDWLDQSTQPRQGLLA
jgi:hypothetical protein